MPKAGTYRSNSVIYFKGDQSDKIFVLQQGKVVLTYDDIETGKPIRELIQTGEFFGVKSALGRYPREENAVVVADATVLIFTVSEFEAFSISNTRIIIKMLKVFSNQLRHIHKQVETLMKNYAAVNPETGLFKTGEYYLKNRMYSQAKYVLGRYLTYYPGGKMANEAAKYLETAETSLKSYGDGKGPSPLAGLPSPTHKPEPQPESTSSPPPVAAPPAKAQASDTSVSTDIAKDYYNAVSLFSQERYQEAIKALKIIADSTESAEYQGKAQFDLGRCLFAINQWDLAIKHFTSIIQTVPKHPDMADMLFIMGQSWEKKGETLKAKAFYTKVLSMPIDEDSSARIKSKRALNALGGA